MSSNEDKEVLVKLVSDEILRRACKLASIARRGTINYQIGGTRKQLRPVIVFCQSVKEK